MPFLIPLAIVATISAYIALHKKPKLAPVLAAKAKAKAKANAKPTTPAHEKLAWREIKSPFLLTPGSQYRAAIMLHGLEPLASNSTIAEKLIKAGFARVKVTGSGGTRIGTGVYRGNGKPKQMASIDKHISRVWRWS